MKPETKPPMNSDCFERARLMAYAAELLEPAERALVDAHLAAGCQACGAVVGEYRRLDSVLEEWKPVEPSPWFDARLRAAISSGESSKGTRRFFGLGRIRWLAPALAAMLVVVASVVAVRRVRRADRAGSAIAQKAPPVAPSPSQASQATAVAVPGGSSVQPGSVGPGSADAAAQAAEDDEMLANFDVLSELPAPSQSGKVEN
jgi:hypothetical protein